jgi:hypothetical protein
MRKSGLACAGPALLAVALTALALLPSSAAALTWGARVPVDPTNDYTSAIDCPTTSLCVVGGDGDRIATSTDPAGGAGTWSVGAVLGAAGALIMRISCPSASLCVAVDHDGEALVSMDPAGGASTWTVTDIPKAGASVRELNGLSCPSTTLCVAADRSHTDLLTGPPTSPATWSVIPLTYSPHDVSCTPDGTCVVAAGGIYTTKTPSDAGSWTEAQIAPFNGSSYLDSVVSVSCLPGLCVGGGAGGGGGGARVYWSHDPTGGQDKWSNEVLTSSLTNMECVGQSTVLCVGSSVYGSFVWSATNPTGGAGTWVATEDAANGGDTTIHDDIAGVSCPTTAACFAATETGYVVMGTGTPGSEQGPVAGSGSEAAGPTMGSAVSARPPHVRFLKNTVTTNAIGFLLESAQAATGALSGVTADSYASASSSAVAARPKHAKRRHVSLGKVRFKLKAHTPKLVKLKIRRPIRELLAKHGKLKVKITITLKNASGRKSVTHRQVTLKLPRRHRSHRS